MRSLTWLTAPVLLLSCTGAQAYPPRPAGPVVDLAGIFPAADEATLSQRLTNYWRTTGNALVVVSVKSLNRQSIENYATSLFNDWGIGGRNADRGLLILIAPNERKVRIEVGCGLEGIITDAVAKNVIETDMAPRYKQNQLEAGTLAGVDDLIENLKTRAANDSGPHTPICKAQARDAA